MKPNKPYLRIFNMLLIMVAYGYLVYRLTIFDDYSSFLAAFKTANIGLWFTLVAIILLMPLNVVAEAGKWRLLLRKTEPMTIWGAQR
jgi:ABC-type Co2+ transport system permease subunit